MLSKNKFLKIKLIRITFRCSSMDAVKASMLYVSDMCMQCKEGKKAGKVLDSIQSITTPDPGYHMGKLEVSPFLAGDHKAA